MAPVDFRGQVLIADFIAVDAAGKISAIGLGWQMCGIDPSTGMTPPQTVAVVVDVPPKWLNKDLTMVLDLRTPDGEAVQVPGVSGKMEALRVQQLVRSLPPHVPGAYLPAGLWGRTQTVISFNNGVPLAPGRSYYWRLEVEHQHIPSWRAHFHVIGAAPAPTFGGPAGPTSIPNIQGPVSDEEYEDTDG